MSAVLADTARYVTFEVGGQLYALPAHEVAEVIRIPVVARVPQGPPALLGVGNLRGNVLPLVSLRALLGMEALVPESARAIVLDAGAAVALVVDQVATLASPDAAHSTAGGQETGAETEAHVRGAFRLQGSTRVARILDIRALLDGAFARRAKAQVSPVTQALRTRGEAQAIEAADTLVTFEVAGQEYALPVEDVQEILPATPEITAMAHTDAAVLGMAAVRDRLLPLLSLRHLLGFGVSTASEGRERIVVLKVGDNRVGLVADRARAVLSARHSLIDAVPPVLAARTGGESRIQSIYRGDGRLISILAPEQLFRSDVMQRLTQASPQAAASQDASAQGAAAQRIFLVFRLAEDEFALPIETVVEVAQMPEQITRVPRTPKFLEGVMNLRGEVLPILDQRRRFDMPALPDSALRRLVVVKTERHRAGLIVDSVSEVLRVDAAQIEPPPQLTEANSRLVHGVINLPQAQRLVLLLDPAELLTRAEQGLLDTFQAARKKADA